MMLMLATAITIDIVMVVLVCRPSCDSCNKRDQCLVGVAFLSTVLKCTVKCRSMRFRLPTPLHSSFPSYTFLKHLKTGSVVWLGLP